MANQVVVSPLLGVVSEKLASFIHKEVGVVWGVEKQMKKLSKTLSKIMSVLIDAEEKQVTDLEIQHWLWELKDAAYTADDFLEEWPAEGLPPALPEMSNNNNTVTKVVTSLKELVESFNEIAKESDQLDLQKGAVVEKRVKISQDRETTALLTEPKVYGRMEDQDYLVKLLLGHQSAHFQYRHPSNSKPLSKLTVNRQENISIYPIVGVGGIGKTTLAQLVYEDPQVANHFDVRSWVWVSEDFDIKRLMRQIIFTLSRTECASESLDTLQQCLQKNLGGKKFLLVLDDVWEESMDEWNKLKGSLACGVEGSCVIVTTRLKTVASITGTGTVPPYCLKGLSRNDCWLLFKQRAFGFGSKENPDLIKIGKKVVKKCGGVPLAAKSLGGLLRFKSEPREWLLVKDSEIWELPNNGILPILRLSYNHLPSNLRQCFAYCSIFPKDHEINKKELIHLWMGNGFVQSKGRMQLEDAGNDIFDALLWRSFFEDGTKDECGNIKTYKMHDLVHDLACHVAGGECSTADVNNATLTRRTRHVSLLYSSKQTSSVLEHTPEFPPCLRSLIVLSKGIFTEECQFFFSHLIRLRALDLSWASVQVLPDSISNMKHLRYLNFSKSSITSLPETVCKLRNLQTLDLSACVDLEKLPQDMSKMNNLRHLDIRDCYRLRTMPVGMRKLIYLQTLSLFIVGRESGQGIDELQGLNIGGELEIKRLENVNSAEAAKKANLKEKENLRSLVLSWADSEESVWKQNATEEVLEGLQPHPNLRRISVSGYGGKTFARWFTVSSLPALVEIHISSCKRCEYLPPLKRLPLLKVLEMYEIDKVEFIDEADGVNGEGGAVKGEFMSLERLELRFMPNLKGWSSLNQEGGARDRSDRQAAQPTFPCLKILTLEDCPTLMGVVPLPSSIESVEVNSCNVEVLKSLQNLPRLSSIKISGFDKLKHFPQEMLGNVTSLEQLEIDCCMNLEDLPVELESLTMLTKLRIANCPRLMGVVPLPSSILSVEVNSCNERVLGSLQNLPHLSSIKISGFDELKHFPQGMLRNVTSLQKLEIDRCMNLEDLPLELGSLTTPKMLRIANCDHLKRLPNLVKNHRTTLEIMHCPELKLDEYLQNLAVILPSPSKHLTDSPKYVLDIPDWIGPLKQIEDLYNQKA